MKIKKTLSPTMKNLWLEKLSRTSGGPCIIISLFFVFIIEKNKYLSEKGAIHEKIRIVKKKEREIKLSQGYLNRKTLKIQNEIERKRIGIALLGRMECEIGNEFEKRMNEEKEKEGEREEEDK
jgi:hypothetical protein